MFPFFCCNVHLSKNQVRFYLYKKPLKEANDNTKMKANFMFIWNSEPAIVNARFPATFSHSMPFPVQVGACSMQCSKSLNQNLKMDAEVNEKSQWCDLILSQKPHGKPCRRCRKALLKQVNDEYQSDRCVKISAWVTISPLECDWMKIISAKIQSEVWHGHLSWEPTSKKCGELGSLMESLHYLWNKSVWIPDKDFGPLSQCWAHVCWCLCRDSLPRAAPHPTGQIHLHPGLLRRLQVWLHLSPRLSHRGGTLPHLPAPRVVERSAARMFR